MFCFARKTKIQMLTTSSRSLTRWDFKNGYDFRKEIVSIKKVLIICKKTKYVLLLFFNQNSFQKQLTYIESQFLTLLRDHSYLYSQNVFSFESYIDTLDNKLIDFDPPMKKTHNWAWKKLIYPETNIVS